MAKKIFIFSLVIASIIQGFIFVKLDIVDLNMWAKQAEYVQTGNPAQFDFLQAYGHPGGPIIEGTIFFHSVFGLSYRNSLLIFMTILNSLAIAGASVLCYFISKNSLWWLTIVAILSSNWLYIFSTPPSIVVSILICLLGLFSLYIYEKKEIKPPALALLSILIGLVISTRVDVGAVMVVSFLIFMKPKIIWRQIFFIILGAGLFFILFDPFMWFMPIQHVSDLLFKIIYHYEYFAPSKISLFYMFNISTFLLLSIFLSAASLFLKEKNKLPIPPRFIYTLFITTIVLCFIFFTSQYQTPRYFLPIINIWETLLPLLIFSLASNLKPVFSKIIKIFFVFILTLSPLIILICYL
jgi:hypothetical protein